jgi:hypothetical protein
MLKTHEWVWSVDWIDLGDGGDKVRDVEFRQG